MQNIINQDKFYSELGGRVRKARIRLRLTQEQLASSLSLNRTSITNIEKGKQKMLAHTLLELAEVLEIPVNDLIPPVNQMSTTLRIDNLIDKNSSNAERNFLEATLNKAKKDNNYASKKKTNSKHSKRTSNNK